MGEWSEFGHVGDPVRQGQLLAEMHSHEVHDVRAELTKAQAELDRRRSELQFARKARDRTARLYQLKAASLEQLQRAEADLSVAEQAVISAKLKSNGSPSICVISGLLRKTTWKPNKGLARQLREPTSRVNGYL